MIVHEYERIETRLGDATGTDPATYFESGDPAGNGVYNARALFLGAQSLCHVIAKNIGMETETLDYGNREGVAIAMIYNTAKTRFNSEDYGVITVDHAIVPDA